jgi:hypothetical protein
MNLDTCEKKCLPRCHTNGNASSKDFNKTPKFTGVGRCIAVMMDKICRVFSIKCQHMFTEPYVGGKLSVQWLDYWIQHHDFSQLFLKAWLITSSVSCNQNYIRPYQHILGDCWFNLSVPAVVCLVLSRTRLIVYPLIQETILSTMMSLMIRQLIVHWKAYSGHRNPTGT